MLDIDAHVLAAAFLGRSRPRVVDEQRRIATDATIRNCGLVRAVKPGAGDVQEEFADQRRRLQRVVAALAPHVRLGDAPHSGYKKASTLLRASGLVSDSASRAGSWSQGESLPSGKGPIASFVIGMCEGARPRDHAC